MGCYIYTVIFDTIERVAFGWYCYSLSIGSGGTLEAAMHTSLWVNAKIVHSSRSPSLQTSSSYFYFL